MKPKTKKLFSGSSQTYEDNLAHESHFSNISNNQENFSQFSWFQLLRMFMCNLLSFEWIDRTQSNSYDRLHLPISINFICIQFPLNFQERNDFYCPICNLIDKLNNGFQNYQDNQGIQMIHNTSSIPLLNLFHNPFSIVSR